MGRRAGKAGGDEPAGFLIKMQAALFSGRLHMLHQTLPDDIDRRFAEAVFEAQEQVIFPTLAAMVLNVAWAAACHW